jgi:hypothetical protein
MGSDEALLGPFLEHCTQAKAGLNGLPRMTR